MEFIVYFDIAALVILTFLMVSLLVRKQYDGLSNKLYFLTLAITFICSAFDILASLPVFNRYVLFTLNTFYMFFRIGIVISFFTYALTLARRIYKINAVTKTLLIIPAGIHFALMMVNIPTKIIFNYTEELDYVRGPFIFVIYALSLLYGVISLFVIIRNRQLFSKTKLLVAIIAIIIQSLASFFQFMIGNLLLEMFATVVSLFLLAVFVEKPEEFLDFKTQLYNANAFTMFVQRNIDRKRPFSVIIAHINNITSLYNIYRYREAISYLKDVSIKLSEDSKKICKEAHTYYIGQGTYAICFFNNAYGKELLNNANNFLNHVIDNRSDISFHFNAELCLVECPEDFKDVDSIVGFSNSFYNILTPKNNIVEVRKHRNELEANILFSLDKIIDEAITNESFEMHYQPIFSVKKQRFNSAEALVRLNDKVYGQISPALFIPYAEKTGKMTQIGNIILNRVFEFIGSERFKDLNLDYIEINLSILQFLDTNMIDNINTLVENYGIDRNNIWFELTETVAIAGDRIIENNIYGLDKEGYVLTIDDFGTGYSNIARLARLPMRIIKLDKSLVDQSNDPKYQGILKNLCNLITSYGPEVLAEGVETQETLEAVLNLGVNYIQGFYYSRALPLKEFIDFIVKNNKKAS